VILLFPEGRLPSPRWRLVLSPYAMLAAVFLAASYLREVPASRAHRKSDFSHASTDSTASGRLRARCERHETAVR
jgi:hypothetical protein